MKKTLAPPSLALLSPLPPFKPLFDYPVRDPAICLAPDGFYYLTGTTGHPDWWTSNDGIRLWRAKSLDGTWEALGLVWEIQKHGIWQKEVEPGKLVTLWAPEIHHLKGTFWLTYSIVRQQKDGPPLAHSGLLKSTSGQAAGPYADVAGGPLAPGIDASLFQDDDGAVYWVQGNGTIARMTDDMTAFAEKPRLLSPADYHQVGFEGAFIAKIGGRYHLICAEFAAPDGTPLNFKGGPIDPTATYSCFAASSDKLLGPYGPRYLAIPHGGHNMLFRDKAGQWWSTFFGNDAAAPFRERPAILKIAIGEDGRIHPLAVVSPVRRK